MKKILVILMAVMSFGAANSAKAQINSGITFNTFYNELSPYGRWINDARYGQVWVSNQRGFEPYYDNGHWAFTNYGWTWISDYPWGWAPFHYGRWAFTSYGWAWVPGYEWAPAWVGWCQNDGYYGWAPLSPGLGFNISFNNIPRNRWRFVQHQYINSPTIRNHYIRPDRNPNVYNNVTIINNTQVINNTNYVAGPKREDVERVTRKKIEPKQVAFNETTQQTQVDKTQVKIYRPDVKANQAAESIKPAPVSKEENAQAVPLQNTDRQDALVKPQPNQQPALTEQQKAEQAAERRRQKADRLQQVQPANPVQQPVETGNPQPAVEQNKEQLDLVKPQNVPQRQEAVRQQQLQEQKNQQEAARQQELQRQADRQRQTELQQQKTQQQQLLKQQQIQAQKEQQQAAKQLELQRQNELQEQKAAQQNQLRQQQIEDQKNRRQQVEQEQRVQRQNEIRQQRLEQPQAPSQPAPERKPLQRSKAPF